MAEFDDFGLLAQMARRELIHLLESMPEVKDLAVEPSLMRPLDKIASMSVLQEHNCAHVQQFSHSSGSSGNLTWGAQSLRRVYIIRPTLPAAKRIAEQILAEPERNYSVIFVPQRLYVCELELERRGVLGMIDIMELDLPLIRIDSHLFSLEHHEFTSATLVDRTFVHLRAVAKSLWQLQSLYGLIPIVYGVGECSAHVNKLMKKFYTELGEPRASPDQPIGHLFLLDRSLDLATVFLTGLTYESMLHDTFGISCGKVTFGDEVNRRMKGGAAGADGDPEKKNRPRITTLDNNDPIFSAVRNMHMTAVFPFLSAKAKSLQASYDKGSSLDQVKDMKEFVSNELRTLKQQHRHLELHICACEAVLEQCKGISDRLALEHALVSGTADPNEVMAYLEDCMCAQRNQWQVLILACLWSLTQNGIPARYFSQFRTQYLHAFGHENLPALHFLGIQGLLIERPAPQLPVTVSSTVLPSRNNPPSAALSTSTSSSSPFSKPTFQYLARRMALLPGDSEPPVDLRNPDQMRYVFSGAYTSVLCKIIGDTVSNGWNMQEMRATFGDSVVFCDQNSYTRASRPPDSRIRKAVLVYFIGGVTYAEVAALTLLAQHNNLRIVIAATNIIHREKFIKEMANVTVKPKLYVASGSRLEALLRAVPCLNETFTPTWWCPFGFLQTALCETIRTVPSLPFKREIISLDDGGILAVDWFEPGNVKSTTPIVILLPGITGEEFCRSEFLDVPKVIVHCSGAQRRLSKKGSTNDCAYITHAVLELKKQSYRAVVLNQRGLGGVPLKTPKTYNAVWTVDLKTVIRLLKQRFPDAPMVACGFSMGGMILWNYLADCKSAAETGLLAALCISSPFDPHAASLSIERFFPRIFFNSHLTANLKRLVKPYKALFENVCDWSAVMSSRTIRQFDSAFTVPTFGYNSCDDYYQAAALYRKVDHIPIPTLCLNAADDCFSPISSIPYVDIEKSANVAVAVTRHGGHIAFMNKTSPSSSGLVEDLIVQYMKLLTSY